MFDELAAYLDMAATPEQKDLCLDACMTLLRGGEERHVEPIDDELLVAESVNGDPVTNIMQNILLPLYERVLNEFGILFHSGLTLPIAVDMLKGVQLLDNYDNPEAILALIQSDETPEEIFAELLVLGGVHHAEDYLMHIRQVAPELLRAIEIQNSTTKVAHDSDLEPTAETVDMARKRTQAYLTAAGEHSDYIRTRLDEGLRLGLPYALVMAGQVDHMMAVADAKPELCAVYIVGTLMVSDVNYALMASMVDEIAAHTFTDTQQSVTFRNAALKLLREINPGS